MSERFGRYITAPSGQEVFYDGTIPSHIDVGREAFNRASIESSYHLGEIDEVTRNYLLAAYYLIHGNSDIPSNEGPYPGFLNDLAFHKIRISHPGSDLKTLFRVMQIVGLKHYPSVSGGVLDFSGIDERYLKEDVKDIDFAGGIMAATVRLSAAQVVRDVKFTETMIQGDLEIERARIGRVLALQGAVIGKNLRLDALQAGFVNLEGINVPNGTLSLRGAVIPGGINFEEAQIGTLDLTDLETNGKLMGLSNASIGRYI